jgi:hypothetical protein
LLSDTKPWKFLLLLIFSANWGNSVVVICISRSRNHFLTYREKNCRRGRLRPRHDNLEAVKGVHNKSLNSFILAFFLDEQLKSYSFINISSEDLSAGFVSSIQSCPKVPYSCPVDILPLLKVTTSISIQYPNISSHFNFLALENTRPNPTRARDFHNYIFCGDYAKE